MGSIVKVYCRCGFEDELHIGTGMNCFEVPALQDEQITGADPSQNFRLRVKDRRFVRTKSPHTARTKRILSSETIEEALDTSRKISFDCPYCDSVSMNVFRIGCWD